MDYIFLLIGLVIGTVLGYLFSKSRSQQSNNEAQKLNELQVERDFLLRENDSLKNTQNELKQELAVTREKYNNEVKEATTWKSKHEALDEKLEEQKSELTKLQEKFTKEFELVANKILDEKSTKFTDQNRKNLDEILSPLKERISEFQKKVEDNNEKSIERVAHLDKHLKMLRELNQEITQETRSLTQALRGDSKAQGGWGEMQLEGILAKAGLEKDIHYTKETNLKSEDGQNQRLDFIINLPDEKHIVLDSKVSLTAYSNYFDAENEDEKEAYLKDHITSINKHIKELGKKDYQKLHGIHSPDYILMFVANEPALNIALREDHSLFEKALDKNIVLVGTSTLLATLRTISYIWKQDLQNKNAEEIARQAASLYDKFVNFSEDLITLGNQLKTVTGTYEKSMNRLSEGKDNLVRKTERLKDLGVNPSKNLNPKLLDRSKD